METFTVFSEPRVFLCAQFVTDFVFCPVRLAEVVKSQLSIA